MPAQSINGSSLRRSAMSKTLSLQSALKARERAAMAGGNRRLALAIRREAIREEAVFGLLERSTL